MGHEDTDDKVDFVILDCPISSMEWMINEEMKGMNTGIPVSFMSWCGNIVNRLKLGFSYKDADVAAAMRNVETPVLIINSKADNVTPYFMGKEIYDGIRGNNKQIWTVEDSEHAMMWVDHKTEYRNKVNELLDSIEKK